MNKNQHYLQPEIYAHYFDEYGARTKPLAEYLHAKSCRGFTAKQFEIYRDNYFYRTATTVEAVARAALSCAIHNDRVSLACLAQNLNDESGSGMASMNHQALLESSHNIHGKAVFELPETSIPQSSSSKLLIDETLRYRRIHSQLLSSGDHVTVLAASYAQEQAASGMLELFKSAFFVPYRDRYSVQQFSEVTKYFSVHLDEGVEENHGLMAWKSLSPHLTTQGVRRNAADAIEAFLGAQADVWDGLLLYLGAAETEGDVKPVVTTRLSSRN
jgi:hypothetical protein